MVKAQSKMSPKYNNFWAHHNVFIPYYSISDQQFFSFCKNRHRDELNQYLLHLHSSYALSIQQLKSTHLKKWNFFRSIPGWMLFLTLPITHVYRFQWKSNLDQHCFSYWTMAHLKLTTIQ